MKTLLITLDFLPNRGGISNYYFNIFKNFPKNELVVLTNVKGEEEKNIIRRDLNFGIFHFFETLKQIKKIVSDEKIEQIIVGNILPIGKYAYFIKKSLKINYYIFIHGLDIKLAQSKTIKKFITKKILDNARIVFANSKSTKSIIKTKTPIEILYPGVNENFKNIGEEKKLEILKKYNLENKKIILTVGRIIKRKNHELIIKTINELRNEFENLLYLIAGTGDNLEHLKNIAKDNKNIIFLGDVTDQELPYLYSICDIFAMISHETKNDTEGFGIVYLEAALFKKPSLAANSGGAKEAVIDNVSGLLINNESLEELKNAIRKLLTDNNLREKLGENAYTRTIDNFTWEKITHKLIKKLNA
ncbi:MAG: glycosyltransferase family 4 protein [Patescibacteria group bacterium]|nr:glycosyltransferase family 4 protein [Patescibacteria group bacterium]